MPSHGITPPTWANWEECNPRLHDIFVEAKAKFDELFASFPIERDGDVAAIMRASLCAYAKFRDDGLPEEFQMPLLFEFDHETLNNALCEASIARDKRLNAKPDTKPNNRLSRSIAIL